MKTISISQEEMASRVAHFSELNPLATQDNPNIPLEAQDLIFARRIMCVIGLEDVSPVSQGAPIQGAGGMTMAFAACPPGQGPSLHSHQQTYENFIVMEGTFEVAWNDDGSERVVIEKYDTISVPPGVCRSFRNVGDTEGMLMVIITGGVHDMQDIAFPPHVADAVEGVSATALDEYKKIGFAFNAGQVAAE